MIYDLHTHAVDGSPLGAGLELIDGEASAEPKNRIEHGMSRTLFPCLVKRFTGRVPRKRCKLGERLLGLEYFVSEGDELWNSSDTDLVALGTAEMERLGLLEAGLVEQGFVVRMPKAYPMYDAFYRDNVDVLRGWLAANAANVHPVGRNGMHRYNNQDHSMYTAMLTVENIVDGTAHDVWEVNVEAEYHEEVAQEAAEVSS